MHLFAKAYQFVLHKHFMLTYTNGINTVSHNYFTFYYQQWINKKCRMKY